MKPHQPAVILAALLVGAGALPGAAEKIDPAPAQTPLVAKPPAPPTYEARFKEVKERIAELYAYRNRVVPPLEPRHNPFRTPGSIVMAARTGTEGEGGARVPAGTIPAPADTAPGTSLSLLQQGAATLRVSGIVEISGRAHLVINKRPYKEGDVVQTQVQGEAVYLRIKEIARRSVTLSLDDAEMTLKF